MRILGWILVVLVGALAAAWFFGPRVPVDTTVAFDPATVGDDVQAWIAAREAAVPNIRDELKKRPGAV